MAGVGDEARLLRFQFFFRADVAHDGDGLHVVGVDGAHGDSGFKGCAIIALYGGFPTPDADLR